MCVLCGGVGVGVHVGAQMVVWVHAYVLVCVSIYTLMYM